MMIRHCQFYHHCLGRGELCCYGEAEEARADHREPAQHLRGEAGRADQARWVLEEEGTVSWRLGISPFFFTILQVHLGGGRSSQGPVWGRYS